MTLADPMLAGQNQTGPKLPIPHGVLAGPHDPNLFRVEHGKYKERWYVDPLPADDTWEEDEEDRDYPSQSLVKKASGQDWSYVACKRIAKEIIKNPRRFFDLDYEDVKNMLVADNSRGLRFASERGTNVHTYFEKGLYGLDIDYVEGPHERGAEYLPAVRQFFIDYQPTLFAAEYVAINRGLNGHGYGCTGDAIIELTNHKGERVKAYVDWKSRAEEGQHAIYDEEAAQLGAARFADYMVVEGERGAERRPLPEIDLGVIVSIRPDGCRVYPVNLPEAFEHFTALHAWWVAQLTSRKSIRRVWPVPKPTPLLEQIERTTSVEQGRLLWRLHKDGGQWTAEHTAALQRRWPKEKT